MTIIESNTSITLVQSTIIYPGRFVAIKNNITLFHNPIETKRAIREVQVLRKLRHEDILGLLDLMMNDVKDQIHCNLDFVVF